MTAAAAENQTERLVSPSQQVANLTSSRRGPIGGGWSLGTQVLNAYDLIQRAVQAVSNVEFLREHWGFLFSGIGSTLLVVLIGWALRRRRTQATARKPAVQLAPVVVIPRKPFPMIDVRLLNHGDAPALIHRLEVVVVSSERRLRIPATAPPVRVSHVYHLLLDPAEPDTVNRDIAFEVPASSVDRFQLVIGCSPVLFVKSEPENALTPAATRSVTGITALCKLRLHFSNHQTIESESFTLAIDVDPHFLPGQAMEVRDLVDSRLHSGRANPSATAEVIELMGYLDEDGVAPTLIELMGNKEPRVAVEAAVALTRMGRPEGLAHLIQSALDTDVDASYRVLCIRGLIRAGHVDPITYVRAVRDPRCEIRREVVPMLGHLREKRAVPELTSMLADRDSLSCLGIGSGLGKIATMNREVEEIVRALGKIGDESAVPAIAEVLADERTYREVSYELLIACLDALARIGGQEARELLELQKQRVGELLGFRHRVEDALERAIGWIQTSTAATAGSPSTPPAAGWGSLIADWENDDFPLAIFRIRERGKKAREKCWVRFGSDRNKTDFYARFVGTRGPCTAQHFHISSDSPESGMALPSPSDLLNLLELISPSQPPASQRDEVLTFEGGTDIAGDVERLTDIARASLPAAVDRFRKGLPEGHTFYVKTWLGVPGVHRESAFVRVAQWSGGRISGTIATDLQADVGYEYGDTIELEEDDIFDWMIVRPDGSEEGNLVGKFLESQAS